MMGEDALPPNPCPNPLHAPAPTTPNCLTQSHPTAVEGQRATGITLHAGREPRGENDLTSDIIESPPGASSRVLALELVFDPGSGREQPAGRGKLAEDVSEAARGRYAGGRP